MKPTELTCEELETVAGGDLAYDLGRAIRFVYFSGGGPFIGNAVADWMAVSAINSAKAEK
jgi:hypothetical protein